MAIKIVRKEFVNVPDGLWYGELVALPKEIEVEGKGRAKEQKLLWTWYLYPDQFTRVPEFADGRQRPEVRMRTATEMGGPKSNLFKLFSWYDIEIKKDQEFGDKEIERLMVGVPVKVQVTVDEGEDGRDYSNVTKILILDDDEAAEVKARQGGSKRREDSRDYRRGRDDDRKPRDRDDRDDDRKARDRDDDRKARDRDDDRKARDQDSPRRSRDDRDDDRKPRDRDEDRRPRDREDDRPPRDREDRDSPRRSRDDRDDDRGGRRSRDRDEAGDDDRPPRGRAAREGSEDPASGLDRFNYDELEGGGDRR